MKTTRLVFKTALKLYILILLVTSSCTREPILKDILESDFYIGTALNFDQILGKDQNSLEIFRKHFNSVTSENVMKWEKIHPELNKYNFEFADSFVALGERNNMFIIGHTLIWHSQVPDWVFEDESGNLLDRDLLLQRMRDHILSVVGRYKGRVDGWDVVNEAVEGDGQMRKNKWFEIIGEDYVQKAFEYASEADPEAKLYYNDFSLCDTGRRAGVVRMISDLKSKGVPIDGIGIQGHWLFHYPSSELLEETIQILSELDIDIMITEMDIAILPRKREYTGADISVNFELKKELDPYSEGLPDSIQTKLANRYSELFEVLHRQRDKISRVTLWGVHDGQSWLNNWPIKGRTSYPLLFDREYQTKPAFNAIVHAVENED